MNFAVRMFYLRRLFPDFRFLRHTVARAAAQRARGGADPRRCGWPSARRTRSPAALALFALYVVATLGATALVERRLLREILAYLRRRPAAGAPRR